MLVDRKVAISTRGDDVLASGLDLRTEEDVKVKFLLPLLERHGYKTAECEFERAIEVQEGRRRKNIFADIIVYSDKERTTPLICCETKGPDEVLDRATREQAISYARLLPKIAPLVLITNGRQVQVFQAIDKTRIESLPEKKSLQQDFVNSILSRSVREDLVRAAKHELFTIDDVQTFKRTLKSCHDEIRNNEGYDPTEAFDELSKVLFCKMHEEKRAGTNRFRSSVFDQTLNDLGVNIVQKIFQETTEDPRYSALFNTGQVIQLSDRTLRRMVELFESTDLSLTAFDVKGEAFEYFLGDTFTGGLGQYFTPRSVVQFIVDAIELSIGEKIVDPFCGTGGFLIHAFETVSERIRFQKFAESEKEKWRIRLSDESLYGSDWAARTSQTCKMNMVVHGDGSAGIVKHHGLLDVPGIIEEGQFDVCLTNPPFGSFENDPSILADYELGGSRKSQDRVVLAVERCIRLVKPGGRIGIVVIDGVLNNSSGKYIRDYLRRHAWIRGVVGLAKETFEGYGGRSDTSVLLLEKKQEAGEDEQGEVFMAIARNTGYGPSGDPIPGNELPDILLDYEAFRRGDEFGATSGAWSCRLRERLDPIYYEPRTATRDARTLAASATALKNNLFDSAHLAQSLDVAARLDLDKVPTHTYRLSELVEEFRDPFKLDPEHEYPLLGVRWWGEGAFVRERKFGRDVKATTLYRTRPDSLVYNRLFAYRGSFAYAGDELDDVYASNEFPMFTSIEDDGGLLLRYLTHLLNSPSVLAVVDSQSTGSTKTSRNRFMQAMFLDLDVRVPAEDDDVERIVEAMDNALNLKMALKQQLDDAKALHEIAGLMMPN